MLSFDSLDNDGVPDDAMVRTRRKRYTYIPRSTAWSVVGAVVIVVIIVGLVCGLIVNKKKCQPRKSEISTSSPTTSPSITASTQATPLTSRPSDSTISPTVILPPWSSPRLPSSLKPSHYDLEIQIDIDDVLVFEGTMTVVMTCLIATDVIIMHAKDLEFVSGTARLETVMTSMGRGGDVITPGFLREPWTFPANQYLVAELDSQLVPNAVYMFTIDFNAPLVDGGLTGLYRSSYKTAAGQTRYLAATFFAPTFARQAFPCFDEPAMKATFNITITHRPQYLALSNMPLIMAENITAGTTGQGEREEWGGVWTRSTFERTLPMATYPICYVVCDFKYATVQTTSNVSFSVWVREEALPSISYALHNGVLMLDYYDFYFGTKFPLPKMDMIAIPDSTVSAMENWGLITYRESLLLFTPGETDANSMQQISFVMAHELAHQWFGNLVSFEWWNDLWLKEGFANYMAYVGSAYTEPQWAMPDQFVSSIFYVALKADAMATSRPIILDVLTADDINQQYDSIAYDKGASIIRMIQNFLGEDAFRRGLQIYLDRYKYANAVNTDLWNCFTEAADEHNITDVDVKLVMDTWTLQMGYPTVYVTREYSSGNQIFVANQSRFLMDPQANTTSDYGDLGYEWHVPLNYMTSRTNISLPAQLDWIRPHQSLSIDLRDDVSPTDWLLINVDAYGYYRVNYNAQNWQLLAAQLRDNHEVIPVSNRAALISDALHLAQAGDLNYTLAMSLCGYLRAERHNVPWSTAQKALGYLDLMLSRSASYGLFTTFMSGLVDPFYAAMGWQDGSGDHLEQLSRVVAISIACHYGNRDCVSKASSLFRDWMANSTTNQVPRNQKSSVYCTAIAEGGQAEWAFAFQQYETTIIASERSILLEALACSKRPWLLSKYLTMTLDQIKSQDAANVVKYVSRNPIGYDLAWRFFQSNWDFFRNRYGDGLYQFATLIGAVTDHFNTESQLIELQNFISSHPDQGTGAKALQQALEQTQANVRWVRDRRASLHDWLQTNDA